MDCKSIGGVFLMAKELKPGDRLQWNTSLGKPGDTEWKTPGQVEKKLASSKKIEGYPVKASKQNPEY